MIIKKPVIGITPSHNTENDDISLRPTYLRAILAAGGVPVVLPLEAGDDDLKMFAHMFDGFLFSGGPDPHPFLFGEETQANCHSQGYHGTGPFKGCDECKETHSWHLPRRTDHQCGPWRGYLPGYTQPDRPKFPHCPQAAFRISCPFPSRAYH